MIPYGNQHINSEDIRAVISALKSPRITQGPKAQEFEEALADYCGAKYAVAVCNGTAALHLAYLAVGLAKGQKALTSPITFAATANAAIYCGATPEFADISPTTFNISPSEVKKKIPSGISLLVPVHFAGLPCEMLKLAEIAKKMRAAVVEDACHALGARYQAGSSWVKVGACAHSDACVFSFHPVKAITTGEGGAITTNRKDLYEKILALRSQGMVKNRPEEPWYYEIRNLGYNYRITDFQCALGLNQLKRLDSFIQKRREIAAYYKAIFKNCEELLCPQEPEGVWSAYHLYPIQLQLGLLSFGRAEIFKMFHQNGLGVQVHYTPLHLQPLYRLFGFRKGDFPCAENYYESAISLPIFPLMKKTDAQKVAHLVIKVLSESKKEIKR